MNKYEVVNRDCIEYLYENGFSTFGSNESFDCIFADPPDNIGLEYNGYVDRVSDEVYYDMLDRWMRAFIRSSRIVWFSYNAKWMNSVGAIVSDMLMCIPNLEARTCIQTFTFGQHRQTDMGNNFRPLLRLKWRDTSLYPDNIRVESERQKMGDKRADPRGRVPGDVFDFPRVTGNSKQRRKWCPTQLHEGLVERCIKLSTRPGGTVLDPFGGTGTTMRVCNRIDRSCTICEIDKDSVDVIRKDNGL